MKNVKIPPSDSYYDYLISSLKDPEESAMYIEVTLEEGDPKLLNLAMGNVVAAHEKMNNLSEEAKLHYQNLSQMLLSDENSEIYTLVALLNEMGFRLEVKPKESESVSS
ncbi:DNA-binding protein [Floridanema evergladense]|uniref:DNA-binding protein n=1 Tax=Floridaenema evergladense BLCC-F167 TaxID=3153639 RepID=A0ABV4WNN8_9CYAN